MDQQNQPNTRLFVGGLAWATTDQTLREHFSHIGEVTDAKVMTDRETGRSRGFGFVEFKTIEEAEQAMNKLDGQELEGRTLKVNFAQQRTQQPDRNFNRNTDFGK